MSTQTPTSHQNSRSHPVHTPRILVLGMHRSGTSLLCGLLEEAGVYFGQAGDFMPPNEENPKGFREHKLLRLLNDELLLGHQCDWSEISQFHKFMPAPGAGELEDFRQRSGQFVRDLEAEAAGRPIGIKDPRLCLLAPYWEAALDGNTLVVFVHRHPDEIAKSLATRNSMPAEVADYLTEIYTWSALSYLPGKRFVLTSFEALVNRPAAEIQRISQAMEAQGLGRLLCDEQGLEHVADPALYRSKTEPNPTGESRPIVQWHRALANGQLPDLPGAPGRAPAAVIEYERQRRFAEWTDLEQRFRSLEARYIALTRPAEAEQWFDPAQVPDGLSRQALDLQRSQRLDQRFIRDVLAHLIRIKQGPDSSETEAALERLRTERERAVQELAGTREALQRLTVQQQETVAAQQRSESELRDSRTRLQQLASLNSELQNNLERISGDLAGAEQDKLELRGRLDFAMRTARDHYARQRAAAIPFGQLQQSKANLDDASAKLLETLRAIRASASWKIAEKQMRLMMSPATLGMGTTGLDVLYEHIDQLQRQVPAAPEPATVPRFGFMRSPLASSDQHKASFIVLNRDGAAYLDKLFSSFLAHHDAKCAEWIIVDHASTDNSREVMRAYMNRLAMTVIEFDRNNSFAYSNNFAAQYAHGEFLVFCNNDIIFDQPLLNELIDELAVPEVGMVGARLYYPDEKHQRSSRLQHGGIRFVWDEQFEFPRPMNVRNPDEVVVAPEPVPSVTAALMACRAADFVATGGFHEGYDYGYEDVDLSLTMSSKLGKRVVLSGSASAIHDESASQRKQASSELARRRRGNIELFKSRFAEHVVRHHLDGNGKSGGARHNFRVGLVVTDDDPDTTVGDFFTASELAEAIEAELGWSCRYLAQRSTTHDWYDCADLDCVLVLIDGYDVSKIRNASDKLLRIAWLRNWFDRWLERPWFNLYDLALCSSERARLHVESHSAVLTGLLRIAANPARFNSQTAASEEYRSDYCFTGSYWKAPREIEHLRPDTLPYRFALYGAGWEGHENFRDSLRGAIPYASIRHVYASSRLLVDDANHVTRPWGSVNSRVFDALASGTLVISNGELGAEETFEGLLPTWSTIGELEAGICHFMEHPEEREALARRLQKLVLERHTYRHRAQELCSMIDGLLARRRLAIKLPVPRWDVAREWGDFHFGSALARSLARLGWRVRLDVLPDWHGPRSLLDEVVLVLRGLSAFEPRPGPLNLMWNISHPDKVSDQEYEQYDHVFIASAKYTEVLATRLKVPVTSLLQCTDPGRFHWMDDVVAGERVVFVGNSRKVQRPIVAKAIEQGLNPEVYGTNWSGLIADRHIHGEHIENERLARFYAESGVVLNDHWYTMKERGFVSNRLFDAMACGARVVSDPVEGTRDIFGGLVYQCSEDFRNLASLVQAALSEAPDFRQRRKDLAAMVCSRHDFDSRAQSIHEIIELRLGNDETRRSSHKM